MILNHQIYEEKDMNNEFLPQGAKANLSGKEFEEHIEIILDSLDVQYETQVKYTNLYGSPRARIDFYIESLNLYIECKNQNVSGSVDEKIPFCLANLLEQDGNSLLVLGGNHFKSQRGQHILEWAKEYVENKPCEVVYEDEFAVAIQRRILM